MSTLEEICRAALPTDPLPPRKERDASIAHAPVRTHHLNESEQKVTRHHSLLDLPLHLSAPSIRSIYPLHLPAPSTRSIYALHSPLAFRSRPPQPPAAAARRCRPPPNASSRVERSNRPPNRPAFLLFHSIFLSYFFARSLASSG